MWVISQGNPAMEITHFERMDLNDLSSDLFNLTREQAVERERREQPIGACPYHTLVSSLLCFSPFSLLILRSLFSSLFSVSFLSCYFSHLFFLTLSDCLLLFLPLFFFFFVLFSPHCAQLRPFYTACCDEFYCFTPQLLLAWCGCPSQTTHWFVDCPAITTILCWTCHVPFPDKIVLFCFLTLVAFPSG